MKFFTVANLHYQLGWQAKSTTVSLETYTLFEHRKDKTIFSNTKNDENKILGNQENFFVEQGLEKWNTIPLKR